MTRRSGLDPDADDGGNALATWLAHEADDFEVERHREAGFFDRPRLRTGEGR